MELSPLFIIIAIATLGGKLNSIYVSIKEKNFGKLKAEVFFLLLMILTIILVYVVVKNLSYHNP